MSDSLREDGLGEDIIECGGCKQVIDDRYFLRCKLCNLHYDLHCANVSESRFRNTMNQEHKENFICATCRSCMPKMGNLNTPVGNHYKSHTVHKLPSPVVLQESLIDLTDYGCSEEVNCVPEHLTHCETDNITVRRKLVNEYLESFNIDRTFEEETVNHQSLRSIIREEIERIFDERLLTFFKKYDEEIISLNNANKETIEQVNNKVLKLEKQIMELEGNIEEIVNKISQNQTPKKNKKSHKADQPEAQNTAPTDMEKDVLDDRNTNRSGTKRYAQHTKLTNKPKMCIISTNKNNSVLRIAERRTERDYELCHYLKSGCDIKQLLEGLETKVHDYDLNDYCIIMLGAKDFIKTNDYLELVLYIREKLQQCHHTNVILCLPTFKYGYNFTMHTSRIENFNRLLYLDVSTLNYAFLLDSNLNLDYDYTTFAPSTGDIKDHGIDIIFKDIVDLIDLVKNNISLDLVSDNSNPNSEFFRL